MSRTSFEKRQREKDRRARAAAKAERRAQRGSEPTEEAPGLTAEQEAALVAELAALHARYDDGDLDLDSFVVARDDITRRLQG